MAVNFVTYDLKVIDNFGSSLIAYWPLWELSGTTSNDISGNSRNGTNTNVTLLGQGIGDGRTSTAYNGTTSYTNVYSTSLAGAFSGAAGTLMAWAKISGAGVWTDATARRVVWIGVNTSTNYVVLGRSAVNNDFILGYVAGGVQKIRSTTTLGGSTAWIFACVTWDKAADEVKAYINGVQIGATLTGLGTWAGSLGVTTCNIGSANSTPIQVFSGSIAHVALGNRALTAGEVAALYVVPFGGSTATVAQLQTEQGRASPYLNVFKPVSLLTASVNNGSITRGARTIAYDGGTGGGFGYILEGQTLEVDTANGTKKTLVKSISGTQVSGTIELYENSIVWADNLAIRIKHFYEPHPIPPAIRSGIFYKFYNLLYSDQNSEPNPVVIMGSHRAGSVSSGAVSFALNAAFSYAVASGATIVSYAWTCVHNGGGISGVTIADATAAITTLIITVADQYWLSCAVTDSNGKVSISHRAIFTDAPYKDFSIQSFSGDWQSGGWRVSIQATGDVELADFPDDSLVVLWYENTLDGVSAFVNIWSVSNEILTCGYLRQDNDTDNWGTPDQGGGTGQVTFQITTIDDLLNNMAQLGSVSIGAVASPSTWYEYASWMTSGRSVHHLILWHTWGVFQCCDVYWLTLNTLGVKNTDYSEASVIQQVNGFAYNRGIFAKLISDRLGRLHFVQDSQMLSDAARAALDTVFAITEDDISGVVNVVREPESHTTFTQLDGFSFDGTTSTPFISIVPGYREGDISYIMPEERGGSTAAISNQVLADQTDSNVRVGRFHALQNNNPRELRISNPYNGLGVYDIIPNLGWYEWDIADADLKRNTELFERLMICRHIDARFNHQAGIISTDIVLEPEAIGPPGIQGNYPLGFPSSDDESRNLPQPDWDEDDANVGTMFGIIITEQARFGQVGSITYGAAYTTFASAAAAQVAMCGLSGTQAIAVYRFGAVPDTAARILNLTGSNVSSAGTELIVTTDVRGNQSVIKLTATKALALFDDGGNIYAVILTVSGSTITAGTIYDTGLDTSGDAKGHACRLSDTLAVVVCHQDKDVGKPQAVTLSIAGTVITPGTPGDATANTNGDLGNVEIAPLDSTSAIVFYRDRTVTGDIRASLLYNINTTTFTLGDDELIQAGFGADEFTESPRWAMGLDTTRAIVVYSYNTGPGNEVMSAIVERSGTTLTAGTPVSLFPVPAGDTFGTRTPTVAVLTSSKAIVAFFADSTAVTVPGIAISVNISGTTITDNADDANFIADVTDSTQLCAAVMN